jgi:hypothetical protein
VIFDGLSAIIYSEEPILPLLLKMKLATLLIVDSGEFIDPCNCCYSAKTGFLYIFRERPIIDQNRLHYFDHFLTGNGL